MASPKGPVVSWFHFARRNRRLLTAGLLILFVITTGYWLLGQHLTLENLKANQGYLLQSSERHPSNTMAVFVACYVMLVTLGVPGEAC